MKIDDTATATTEGAIATDAAEAVIASEARDPAPALKTTKKTKAAAKRKLKTKSKPKAPKRKKTSADVKLRPDGLRQGSAGGLLVDTVCRKAGASHAELCDVVGWKQCMPFVLKSCKQTGVRLRKEREEGGVVRYYGTKSR
jgi:hypothetical protein